MNESYWMPYVAFIYWQPNVTMAHFQRRATEEGNWNTRPQRRRTVSKIRRLLCVFLHSEEYINQNSGERRNLWEIGIIIILNVDQKIEISLSKKFGFFLVHSFSTWRSYCDIWSRTHTQRGNPPKTSIIMSRVRETRTLEISEMCLQ